MNRLTIVVIALAAFLTSFAQNWENSKTVKKQLIKVAQQGNTYYSQYNIYNPRKSDLTTSNYTNVLAVKPYIYGVDFYYASGTWHKKRSVSKSRANLIKIVKEAS